LQSFFEPEHQHVTYIAQATLQSRDALNGHDGSVKLGYVRFRDG